MNTQKSQESKPPDREDGDHTQPINLVASRPSSTSSSVAVTFSGMTVPVATQPVPSRAHGEAPKPSQMTLYFCAPSGARPTGPGHIMSPIMGTDVSSAQHYAAKPGTAFKKVKVGYYQEKPGEKTTFSSGNEFNIKVIRMPPTDSSQSHTTSGSTTQPSTVVTPGILPSSLATTASRHIVPAAVHPVIPAGGAIPAPMASIIKSGSAAVGVGGASTGHQVSQVGHVIHQHYSSHVPRGPAAVASISAGPKSAVATPILRAPSSSGTMTLASSMISQHAPVRARSPTLVTGRTSTPPVAASTTGHPQVIDLQKCSSGQSMPSPSPQLTLTSRPVDAVSSSVRSGISHATSITIAKTISISQPIVQHLQQVSDKSYLKTISGMTSVSSTSGNSSLAHPGNLSSSHSSASEVQSVCVVPTVTRATVSNISAPGAYTAGIVQLPSASAIPQHLPTLRPSLVQPQALHSLTSSVGMTTTQATSRQAFAVISAKTLPSGNHSVTLTTPLTRASISSAVTSCVTVSKPGQPLSSPAARILSAPNTSSQTSIPIAKVYPQPPLSMSQGASDGPHGPETTRGGAQLSAPHTIAMSATKSSSAIVTTVTAATTMSATPVVTSVPSSAAGHSEKRSENVTPVRFASLSKQASGSGASFGISSGAYLYSSDQYQAALSVHPYPVSSSNQTFSATVPSGQLRPLALSQHGAGGATPGVHGGSVGAPSSSSASSVQPLNSLMVAVDSRHVALPYNRVTIGSAKTIAELVPHSATTCASQNVVPAANLGAVSQSSLSSHSSSQNQGNSMSHLSPRPSILRKRTTEPVTSMAKRNLLTSLSAPEQVSPNTDYSSGVNAIKSASPKPADVHSRDSNAPAVVPGLEKSNQDPSNLVPSIKKEIEEIDKSPPSGSMEPRDLRPIETSPRKKPRKQLLATNELIETHSSDAEENFESETKEPVAKEIKTEDEESVKWVTFGKRPSMKLLSNYRSTWKSRHNHFLRYSDVKPKEEKAPSVSDIVNQKGILDEVNGWKIYHLTGQIEDLIEYEESIYKRLSRWLDLEENPSIIFGKDVSAEDMKLISKLTDLVKGNLQRSKIAQEQATECQQQLMKIVDHKQHVTDIINKYASRRPLKKKEKS